jgi:hypothetical protein
MGDLTQTRAMSGAVQAEAQHEGGSNLTMGPRNQPPRRGDHGQHGACRGGKQGQQRSALSASPASAHTAIASSAHTHTIVTRSQRRVGPAVERLTPLPTKPAKKGSGLVTQLNRRHTKQGLAVVGWRWWGWLRALAYIRATEGSLL